MSYLPLRLLLSSGPMAVDAFANLIASFVLMAVDVFAFELYFGLIAARRIGGGVN